MFDIIIRLPDKPETHGRLSVGTYRIGKSPASHIQLDRPEVSSRHAILHVKTDHILLIDVGSTNGTFVDGKRITSDKEIRISGSAVIGIGGEVKLEVYRQGVPRDNLEPASDEQSAAAAASGVRSRVTVDTTANAELLALSGIRFEYRKVAQEIKRRVHEELLTRVNLKNLTISGASQPEIQEQARNTIRDILNELRTEIPSGVDIHVLQSQLVDEAVGLGPLEALLADEDVTEIMVNGAENVFVEKAGKLFRTDLSFAENANVLTVIERIVAPLGRRIDESQPLVDARLLDGSRVNAIIPPLAIDGPALTIRKFGTRAFTSDDLVRMGSISQAMVDFLDLCVKLRKNILISGGTGSGKTTLLNVVSNFLPRRERIVTIEDAAELRLGQPHVVRLEARPPNIEGRGEIKIRDLVRNSLRMRPDRIVVGECRGGEALDMLQAMNTGHDGSLTTLHANSPRDALSRLETLVMMAGFDLPLRAIREQIAAAIAIIVQISRMRDGSRKIVEISEVTGMEGEIITSQELFEYKQEGFDAEGTLLGHHRCCSIVPTFIDEIQVSSIPFDLSMFSDEEA